MGGMSPNERRFQFGLAHLFLLIFVVAVLLGSWRIGWQKVVAAVSLSSALLFFVLWVSLLIANRRR